MTVLEKSENEAALWIRSSKISRKGAKGAKEGVFRLRRHRENKKDIPPLKYIPTWRQPVFMVFLAIASLRNEGFFFAGDSLPKLASEQDVAGEETQGEALASQKGF